MDTNVPDPPRPESSQPRGISSGNINLRPTRKLSKWVHVWARLGPKNSGGCIGLTNQGLCDGYGSKISQVGLLVQNDGVFGSVHRG